MTAPTNKKSENSAPEPDDDDAHQNVIASSETRRHAQTCGQTKLRNEMKTSKIKCSVARGESERGCVPLQRCAHVLRGGIRLPIEHSAAVADRADMPFMWLHVRSECFQYTSIAWSRTAYRALAARAFFPHSSSSTLPHTRRCARLFRFLLLLLSFRCVSRCVAASHVGRGAPASIDLFSPNTSELSPSDRTDPRGFHTAHTHTHTHRQTNREIDTQTMTTPMHRQANTPTGRRKLCG
ncbi:hypothetical protein LSCM4_03582 [Leishmania orientalis]|uniref:Uncharacterized protein n=1 Tax=Leishmania orientalis TaxID=2249476 RepID=A0A836KPM3_9TRYP|nr:hypothetical protein LSCM4_03582 [Leishmania orientalis]